jgi:flagellar assembly protein FliH
MSTSEADAELNFELWRRWEAPGIGGGPEPRSREDQVRPPTAQELEVLRQAAYAEGLAAGRSEGLREGGEEVQAQLGILRSLIGSLARPLERLDARMMDELIALTTALVRQLVRREIRTEPGVIVAAVREAISVLPLSAREIAVKVHPEDAALLRERYPEPAAEGALGWRLVESPAITRGGCVVVTSTSEVDATVERRLEAAIRHVFGGERLADPAPREESTGGPATVSTPAEGVGPGVSTGLRPTQDP